VLRAVGPSALPLLSPRVLKLLSVAGPCLHAAGHGAANDPTEKCGLVGFSPAFARRAAQRRAVGSDKALPLLLLGFLFLNSSCWCTLFLFLFCVQTREKRHREAKSGKSGCAEQTKGNW